MTSVAVSVGAARTVVAPLRTRAVCCASVCSVASARKLATLSSSESTAVSVSILDFWFEDDRNRFRDWWYLGGAEVDAKIKEMFADEVARLACGDLDVPWLEEGTKETALAYIIASNQLPRNLFRGDPRAYATDGCAMGAVRHMEDRGWMADLGPYEHMFATMPLMLAEDRSVQRESVETTRAAVDRWPEERGMLGTRFADLHCYIVEHYGRFPDRNAVLGRVSTEAEQTFLDQGGMYGLLDRWDEVSATWRPSDG